MDESIKARAQKMAEKGIDARTITCHFEAELGRPLEQPEVTALLEAWRAAAPARHERYRKSGEMAAEEVRRRLSR